MAQHRIDNWSTDWEAEIGMTHIEFAALIREAGHDLYGFYGDKYFGSDWGVWNVRAAEYAEALFNDLAEKIKAASAPQAEPAPAPVIPATSRQVDYIMDLLYRRERDGEGGGFFYGPTDREGVAAMTKGAASAYIDSLTGNY